ncbi:MAG: SEC-C domain-containing protein [Acidobacteriota bacterium]|nr:SEC-C domain-containing protein [Acidobacteriota bacterium]
MSLHVGAEFGHGDAEVEALRKAFDHHHVEGILVEPTEILLDALCQNPSLFRAPVPPVSELLERAGLECRGAWIGRQGELAKPPGVVYHERKVKALGDDYGFERCCYVAFDEVLRDWRNNSMRSAVRGDARATARALAHDVVAPAFAEYVLDDVDFGSELLDAFTSPLVELSGKLSAPGHYLRALNAERDGRTLDAESHLRAAVSADPDYPPALFELSWYVADRGDAPRALSLLRRSGAPDDDPRVEYLTSRLDAPVKNVGRNELCPCGSGRKFKVCCANGRPRSLQQRADWLCHKIAVFSLRPQNRWLLESLVDVASHVAGTEVPSSLFPFLVTVAAFEPFALEHFIETRGALLPDEELELARTWLETRPSLWQVATLAKGSSLELLDTQSGERVVVTDRAASEGLSIGDYLLARVVPVGSTWLFTSDFLVVPLMHRASLLELFNDHPDAQDLAAWMGRLFVPIQMANYEGEDVVLCRAVLAPVTTSWERLSEELDRVFRKSEDGQWTEFVEIDGTSMVRVFLRREDDVLVIQTNSVERFERVLKVLREDVGEFEVLDEERTELSSLGDVDAARTQTSSMNDEVAPEVLGAIRKLMREKEDAWLDESIPALRGLTPRQAAADPTRREDLIALLNEFDRRGASFPAMTFDVARLRRQLGLAHS